MLIQFPKHIRNRKSRKRGVRHGYNALRMHPGKAYRINNGIDDPPEWPRFPPPVHHRGTITPPNQIFVERLGFQRPLPALPGNEGLPLTYSSRAMDYVTHGLAMKVPLMGICLTLGYYFAIMNQGLDILDMANSLLEDIQFPFGRPKKYWDWGDKDFQWIYDRNPSKLGWTFKRTADDLSIPFKYKEELDSSEDHNLVPISGPGSHVVYVPSGAFDSTISVFNTPSKTRTVAPTKSRKLPGPPKPKVLEFKKPTPEPQLPEVNLEFEYFDSMFPHRALWEAVWGSFIEDPLKNIFDLIALENAGERLRRIFNIGFVHTFTQLAIGWCLFWVVWSIYEMLCTTWNYLSQQNYRLVLMMNKGCGWVTTKFNDIYGWLIVLLSRIYRLCKEVINQSCLRIYTYHTWCGNRLRKFFDCAWKQIAYIGTWLNDIFIPVTPVLDLVNRTLDSGESKVRLSGPASPRFKNEVVVNLKGAVEDIAADDDTQMSSSEQTTPRARPIDSSISSWAKKFSKEDPKQLSQTDFNPPSNQEKLTSSSGQGIDVGTGENSMELHGPSVSRSSLLHHKIEVKENENAPGGLEFAKRSSHSNILARNRLQDDNNSSGDRPRRSSISGSNADFPKPATRSSSSRMSLDDVDSRSPFIFAEDNSKTDYPTTASQDAESKDTRDYKSDESATPYGSRPQSTSNSVSFDKRKMSFLEQYKSQGPDTPPNSSPSSTSTSRIPRPPLPGASPGSAKPGSVTDRLKRFQK